MTKEEAARPYLETIGPMGSLFRSARYPHGYHIEINSTCNLRCALCFPGNREGYQKTHGLMPLDYLERVLDKAKSEQPQAMILFFGNSEPMLYPHLPEAIAAVKRRGMVCRVSSNLNYVQRLEEVLASRPDTFIVGVSGWIQETYSKSHIGGNIETVKRNLYDLGQLRQRYPVQVIVSYHQYRDNMGQEQEQMAEFCRNLGFEFMPAPARTISMENMISYLRWREKERSGTVAPIRVGKDGLDWNKLLPPPSENYLKNVPRLWVSPEQAQGLYARFPIPDECPICDFGCYIRFDGKVTLCCIMEDRRFDIGTYLDMSREQIQEGRKGNPICEECLRYRLNLYCCLVEQDKWIGHPHV